MTSPGLLSAGWEAQSHGWCEVPCPTQIGVLSGRIMTREPAVPLGSYDPALEFTGKDAGSGREGCFSEGQSRSWWAETRPLFPISVVSLDQEGEEPGMGGMDVSSCPAGWSPRDPELVGCGSPASYRELEPLLIFPAYDIFSLPPALSPVPPQYLLRCPSTSPEDTWCPGVARKLGHGCLRKLIPHAFC